MSTVAAAALATAGAASAQSFDLEGAEVTIGTAQAQVLNVGTLRMIEMLEGWGADVTRVELPNISGLEAIVADRIDVAARSSDEIITGQSRGVDVVAFGAPISTMHYAVVSAPGIDSIEELDGQAIATSGPGGFNGMLFRYMLRQAGLEPEEDVAIVPVGGSSERAAALMAGQAETPMTERTEAVEMRLYREDGENRWAAGEWGGRWAGRERHSNNRTTLACWRSCVSMMLFIASGAKRRKISKRLARCLVGRSCPSGRRCVISLMSATGRSSPSRCSGILLVTSLSVGIETNYSRNSV